MNLILINGDLKTCSTHRSSPRATNDDASSFDSTPAAIFRGRKNPLVLS